MRSKIISVKLVVAFLGLLVQRFAAQTVSNIQLKSPLPFASPSATSSEPMRFGFVAKPPAPILTRELFAPFFISDESFKPTLVLQNMRVDVAVTVRPALLIDNQEISIPAVTLAPKSTYSVPLNPQLSGQEKTSHTGAVVVRYDFAATGAVSAVVQSDDTKHGIYLASLGNGIEEFMGTTFESVFWAPDPDTQGFLALLNTSTAVRTVQPTAFIDGDTIQLPKVVLGPLQGRTVRIDNIVRRSTRSGAGIRLESSGSPGDIRAEGFLIKKDNGFSKRFQFVDTMLEFGSPLLRTNLFMLGKQPSVEGFSSDISFRSIAVLRNIASLPITVTPTVKYIHHSVLRVVALKPITISANKSATIDFSNAQREGSIPAEFHQGSLELIPNIVQHSLNPPSIIAELFNFNDRTGGFVIGPSFTARASRGTSSIWRIDASFQTVILIDNTADQEDKVTLTFNGDGRPFSKTFPIAPGALLRVSVKDLQLNAAKDNDSSLLLGTYGTVSILGAHGRQSAIAVDRIIYSSNEADYLGYPASPCTYITDATAFLSGNSNPFTTVIEDDWSDGSISDDPTAPSSVSDPTVAQVNGSSVTFSAPGNGSNEDIAFGFVGVEVGCGGCSTMTTTANFSTFVKIAVWNGIHNGSDDGGCRYDLYCPNGNTNATCKETPKILVGDPDCLNYIHASELVIDGVCLGGPGNKANFAVDCS